MDRNHNILPGTVGPAGVVMKNPDTGYNAHNDDDWPDNVTDKMAAVMEARPRGTPVSIAEIRDEVQRNHDGDLDQLAFLAALRSLAAEDAIMHNERAATVLRR